MNHATKKIAVSLCKVSLVPALKSNNYHNISSFRNTEIRLLGVQAELKKYDELKQGIAQNVGRQAQLLGVLGSQQGAYKSAFGFTEWRQSCGVRFLAHLDAGGRCRIRHFFAN